ncbi:MAG: DNA/RNA nuclease SfsA [Clostridium perfringens]|nr:DNA/RNA nuclease SfsA [Clostridium perfringens]
MNYNKNIVEAKFLKRPNRFQAYVLLNDEELMVHVPNTGRCKELLISGCVVLLREENNPKRKTKYSLVSVYKNEELINIDSQAPNKIVEEALLNGDIPELRKYDIVLREKTFGNSRFDFKLENLKGEEYYLEVKGVTLEENRWARFPDAPTERGKKHILELIEVKNSGKGAGIVFLIQIKNVDKFSPNGETDPKFSEALKLAKESGVEIFAYNCSVGKEEIKLLSPVEIIL